MRILTVRQPWAFAIIHRGKDVENRTTNIAGSYRGPVAIHAAAAWDWDVTYPVGPTPHPTSMSLIRGAIIGVVDLIDVHSASVIGGCGRMDNNCDEHPYGCRRHCSPWAMGPTPDGWYQHLVLANPRALSEPVPFKGALGLRRLDVETIALIESRLS